MKSSYASTRIETQKIFEKRMKEPLTANQNIKSFLVKTQRLKNKELDSDAGTKISALDRLCKPTCIFFY